MSSAEKGALESERELVEPIVYEASRLIEHIRCSAAPPEVVAACVEHLRSAISLLEPWRFEGVRAAAQLDGEWRGFSELQHDLRENLPYSPVMGRKNPVAPAIAVWADGKVVRGQVKFSATFAGPPGGTHGGVVAAVFDELLAMANIVNCMAGYTGSLNIRYHRLTPLLTDIDLYAECTKVGVRSVKSRGEMRVNGQLTASAEGVFIKPAGVS